MAKVVHREEVLNVVFAECLVRYGVSADPETVRKRHLPDVVFDFRGLRCVIEGKHGDAAQARRKVAAQAMGRVETGLAQLAIAVLYPSELKNVSFEKLPRLLVDSEFEFAIATESGLTDWHAGGIGLILAELRRAQETLARDDVVQQIAVELS